ncbi:MAG TPA: serine hydrolase domain-containing protein [Terracidiphilus sp.]|nr:serine hydrolase domain-containing protein [Terracidiphilus sp.]
MIRPIRTALFLIACMLSAGSSICHSQSTSPLPMLDAQQQQSIDSFVAGELARQRIPGLALGIYSRGRILLAKGYGLSNVELNVPVKAETIFQSGSVGKQFVSAAIMMLVEEGKISLDDNIAKFFPDAPASWKPILIENLLSHTSGLSEYESDDRTGPNGTFYLRLDFTEDELVKKIEALPIEWSPGSNWAYRNTNYVLLGVILHKITGMRYDEFLAERIFKPLGMASTRLISEHDIIPNRAAGYQIDDGQLKNQDWVSPTFNSTADGALYFNVLDLARWDEALYGTRLLKQSSLDRIWTVYPLNNGKLNPAGYGFAWEIGEQNGHKRIEHGGAWQGFTCNIARYPNDSLTVVVLTNLDAGHSDPDSISHVVAGLVASPLIPARLLPIADDQPAIATKLSALLDKAAAGQDIRPLLTADLAARVPSRAAASLQRRLAPLWPDGAVTLVRRKPSQEYAGQFESIFRLHKGSEAMLIEFGLDAQGRISKLGFMTDRPYE